MRLEIKRGVGVVKTPRALQLSGLFDVPPAERSESAWSVELPLEDAPWQVGLVVGPSGSGKSTLAREAFGDALVAGYDWPADRAVVDGFPEGLSIKDITAALSSVGFSSPPSWLRPFRCLSTGEQFRATLARAILDPRPLVAIDEFTSVVDRTVAQVGSAAVAKAVRRAGRRFVAVTCHHDVADWLDPDWVVEMPQGEFARRSLRGRPPVELEVRRVRADAWKLFSPHHYLSGDHHRSAYCFCAFLRGRPVAYSSVLHWPHARRPVWRGHRTVVLPDFQGVGVGNKLDEFVASLFVATGKPYRDTTSHPAMTRYRLRSPLWKCVRLPSLAIRNGRTSLNRSHGLAPTMATDRLTCSFEYAGPARPAEARGFGIL